MRVLVTGSSGLVGSALLPALAMRGHAPVRLVRGTSGGRHDIPWNPDSPHTAKGLGEGLMRVRPDAVVHLAGYPVASGRWSAARKRLIHESRARDTRLLSETLGALTERPKVLVSASAIGYYGDRGEEELVEGSAPGAGFLPDSCRAWEAATEPAAAAGIRVVTLRIGLVLSRDGGALARMLPAFRLGLGGPLGAGRQFQSWIAIEDLIEIILMGIDRDDLSGAYNAVSPYPVRQAEFARSLGRVLRRPAFLPAPPWALRLLLGEMADALLLSSSRVLPSRLKEAGFVHRHTVLEEVLRALLVRS